MTSFVNPYTFVPHVSEIAREKPAGHSELGAERYSGVLKVRLTARTPLVIGGYRDEREKLQLVPRRSTPDRRVMIPGSGFLGAVRSVHETLVGGCMRVLDIGLRPVHRHPVNNSETDGLQFAVVTEVDGDGRARKVQLCENDGTDFVRVPLKALSRPAGRRLPRTGDQLTGKIPDDAIRGSGLQRKLRVASGGDDNADGASTGTGAEVAAGSLVVDREMRQAGPERWILLVTDTSARDKKKGLNFYAGRFVRLGDGLDDSGDFAVPDETWQSYVATVEDADDMRPATLLDEPDGRDDPDGAGRPGGQAGPGGSDEAGGAGGHRLRKPRYRRGHPEYVPVAWPPRSETMVAERLRARPYLHVGQPVWVRTNPVARTVTEIRLSLLWRYQGDSSVGKRIGKNAQPCQDPKSLCWSCRIFGSADTVARDADDLARQDGYRGHVRFEDLLAEADFDPPRWHLAPLSKPHPSAGQFYLDGRRSIQKKAGNDKRPGSTWGSVADQPERPLRGRKFYWRTRNSDPGAEEHPRGEYRDYGKADGAGQSEKMSKWVQLIPAGTVFSGRVWFDNLSEADYGSLLAALDPRVLHEVDEQPDWPWTGTVTSVGGGKPFGFGSVNVEVRPELVQGGETRYLGEPGDVPSPAAAVEEFRDEVPDAVFEQWKRLRRVLTFGYVQDDLVWYPAYKGDKGLEDYDKSYEFFARNNGLELPGSKGGDHPLAALPDSLSPPDEQVIHWTPPVGGGEGEDA